MLRSRKMRAGLAAAALAAMPLTSACTASYGAPSQAPYTPDQGVWANSGPLELRNILVVSETAGSGTLVATIFNQGDEADSLVAVEVAGGRAEVEPLPIRLSPNQPAVLGVDTSLGESVPAAVESEQVRAGRVVPITFDFERAADVSTKVFVVQQEGAYATVPVP